MRVYISSDMEGSTGVVSPLQVTFGSPEYEFGRRMQLHDTLAAANAALCCGADSVLVNDSHAGMINLDVSKFPEGVEIISGTPKILGMVEGAAGCDIAFFIGYHAMAGTEKAILDHTYHSKVVFDLKVNGMKFGETALNALFCGALGVPVALVSGDMAVCLEAQSILGPGLETCAVKDGLGRIAAITLPPAAAGPKIAESVKRAIDNAANGKCNIFKADGPYSMELTFHTSAQADAAGLVPGSERISGRTLVFNTEDVYELRRWLSSAIETAAVVPF
jgi:D-amino peptidase